MKVSIIIPTYNRNDMLCKTISDILMYEHQYYELIVIDQTKEHDLQTQNFLNNLISSKKINYILLDYPNVANAMNEGIKKASGDIILFFDDDVGINKYTIPSHISGFSDQNIGCITGKITINNKNKEKNNVLNNTIPVKKYIKKLFFLFFNKRASYTGKLGVLSDFTGNKELPSDTCIGCNTSFRKDIFDKCGLFDTNYTGNAVRFETDFSIKIRKYGYKIIYNPLADIIHYMNNTGGTRTAESESYWNAIFRNQCYFYIKNFNFSYSHILFIQIFDILRCRKSGLNVYPLYKKSYKEARKLLYKII